MPYAAVEYLNSHIYELFVCHTLSVNGVDEGLIEAVVGYEEDELNELDALLLVSSADLDIDREAARHNDTAVVERTVELGVECFEDSVLIVEFLLNYCS